MTRRKWLMDEWRDTFLLELRMREVPGARIGEALAEIETHCADSGESPDEAFGDPVAYADALARSLRAEASGGSEAASRPWWRDGLSWRNGLGVFAILGGIFSLLEGVDSVAHTKPGVVTVGQIISVVVPSLLAVPLFGLIVSSGPQSSGPRSSKAKFFAVVLAGFFVAMAPQVIWTRPVLHASGWALLGAGLFLLLLAAWPLLSGRIRADRVVDPRTGREPFRLPRLVLVLVFAAPIVFLLGAVLLTVLLPASPR